MRLLPASCLVAALLIGGCQSTTTAAPDPVTQGTTTAPDGVTIAYDSRGTSDTTLLFVHGWCSNRAFWRDQLDVFAEDFRVVAMDLAGHGASGGGRDRENWSFTSFGGDVKAVADALDLKRIILVGHSMGGPVTLEAARLMPNRVVGIVAVDTLHDADRAVPPAAYEQFAVAFERDFEGTVIGFLPTLFAPDADPELVQWVITESLRADRTMAIAIIRDHVNLDLPAMLTSAGAPVRAINAAPTAARPPTAVEANRNYADFDVVLIQGVGHFPHLEQPEAFNSLMQDVLGEFEQQKK